MSKIVAHRHADFSYGHRVAGHEGKCQHIHGHNGRVTFHCEAELLDGVGRVIDFSVINEKLCQWIETEWDHRFLAYENDPLIGAISDVMENSTIEYIQSSTRPENDVNLADDMLKNSIVWVPFNPTAENLALHLLRCVGPLQLAETDVNLVRVDFMETRKCGVTVSL